MSVIVRWFKRNCEVIQEWLSKTWLPEDSFELAASGVGLSRQISLV